MSNDNRKEMLSDKSVAVIDDFLSQVEGLLQEEAFASAEIRKDSQKGDMEVARALAEIGKIKNKHRIIKGFLTDLEEGIGAEFIGRQR